MQAGQHPELLQPNLATVRAAQVLLRKPQRLRQEAAALEASSSTLEGSKAKQASLGRAEGSCVGPSLLVPLSTIWGY